MKKTTLFITLFFLFSSQGVYSCYLDTFDFWVMPLIY